MSVCVKDCILRQNKHANVTTTNNFIYYGDKQFDDMWAKHDIVLSATSNYHVVLQLMKKAKECKKPLIVMDCPELEVHGHKLISPDNIDKEQEDFAAIIYSKLRLQTIPLDSEILMYPYVQNHTVFWAQSIFDKYFTKAYGFLQAFKANPDEFLNTKDKMTMRSKFDWLYHLKLIRMLYVQNYPFNFDECIDVAIMLLKVDLSLKAESFHYTDTANPCSTSTTFRSFILARNE